VSQETALPPGKWVRVYWHAAGAGAERADQARPVRGAGRPLCATGIDRWPAEAVPLPPRPSDLMAWDLSDSTFSPERARFSW
jgi:hypothetical protein